MNLFQDNDYHCHSNLTRAVLPYGLTEFDVHDVLNVFQCTGLNNKDQYFMKTCPAKKGDYFEVSHGFHSSFEPRFLFQIARN